ncbi:MAG TPA: tetratricopeptide repeat protein [Steroidobacteraceae bacterium]|jgi:tetratricopeptide (TPR) repeat protein
MSLPHWNEKRAPLNAGTALSVLVLAALIACSSEPARPKHIPVPPAATPEAAAPPPAAPARPGPAAAPPAVAPATSGAAAASAAARPEVTPAARADFTRAVGFMRAGNATEAELGFKQMAVQYPQYAAPLVDLSLLQRKQGQLEQAEQSLKSAVAHESGNAVAWTELGVTQRMRGEFKDAAESYENAIAADQRYAPAWRNLGVLADLYLGDPNRALAAFEEYKQITGEDKPVSGWIAELRQRLGMPPAKRPEPAAAPAAPGEAAPAPTPGAPAPGSPTLQSAPGPAHVDNPAAKGPSPGTGG